MGVQQTQRVALTGVVVFYALQDQGAAVARLAGPHVIQTQPQGPNDPAVQCPVAEGR